MSEEQAAIGEEAEAELEAPPAALLPMLFTATSWTSSIRFNRGGRTESEAVYVFGQIAFRAASGERVVRPARAVIVKKEARLRLDLTLGAEEAVINVPLEEFSLERLEARMKELISGYGMVMRIAFRAAERDETQPLGSVDIAFSSPERGAAARGAAPADRS
jgi:hypothetical protein